MYTWKRLERHDVTLCGNPGSNRMIELSVPLPVERRTNRVHIELYSTSSIQLPIDLKANIRHSGLLTRIPNILLPWQVIPLSRTPILVGIDEEWVLLVRQVFEVEFARRMILNLPRHLLPRTLPALVLKHQINTNANERDDQYGK